jgi:hypothetical protein
MLISNGKLHYDDTDGHRITLRVSPDLSDYYRTLIPKYERVFKPRWAAHITVVRPEYDIPPKIRYWGNYEGEIVEFFYDPYSLSGNGYYWVNAWSKRLETIRSELGLVNISKYALRPPGYDKTFHISIGRYDEVFPLGAASEK